MSSHCLLVQSFVVTFKLKHWQLKTHNLLYNHWQHRQRLLETTEPTERREHVENKPQQKICRETTQGLHQQNHRGVRMWHVATASPLVSNDGQNMMSSQQLHFGYKMATFVIINKSFVVIQKQPVCQPSFAWRQNNSSEIRRLELCLKANWDCSQTPELTWSCPAGVKHWQFCALRQLCCKQQIEWTDWNRDKITWTYDLCVCVAKSHTNKTWKSLNPHRRV